MNEITAIIVSYNTYDLLKKCYESIRRFYPDLKVIIIDGSEPTNLCCAFAKSLRDELTNVVSVEYNIGHGKGMHMGIGMAATEYILLIDSDVTIDHEDILENMLDSVRGYYGVGKIIFVDENGHNTNNQINGIQYLHPHFALISREQYFKFPPFTHHGAPCLNSMKGLYNNKTPDIAPLDIEPYITHKGRGTRELNPKEFHPGTWDKI